MSYDRNRVDALLADEATGNLDATDAAELDELLTRNPDIDRHAFHRAASAVFLAANAEAGFEMPAGLTARIVAEGMQVLEDAN
jgi:predicted ABC-type transport system involved in lysophospholipase L1 biosynthesis ATPase subunit